MKNLHLVLLMLVAAYPKHGRPLPTFGNLLSLPNFLQPPPALELDDYDLQQFALLAPDEEDEQVPQNDDTTATPEDLDVISEDIATNEIDVPKDETKNATEVPPSGLNSFLSGVGRSPLLSEENFFVRHLGDLIQIFFFLYNMMEHMGLGMAINQVFHQVELTNVMLDNMGRPIGVAFSSTYSTNGAVPPAGGVNSTVINGTVVQPIGITFTSTFVTNNSTANDAGLVSAEPQTQQDATTVFDLRPPSSGTIVDAGRPPPPSSAPLRRRSPATVLHGVVQAAEGLAGVAHKMIKVVLP